MKVVYIILSCILFFTSSACGIEDRFIYCGKNYIGTKYYLDKTTINCNFHTCIASFWVMTSYDVANLSNDDVEFFNKHELDYVRKSSYAMTRFNIKMENQTFSTGDIIFYSSSNSVVGVLKASSNSESYKKIIPHSIVHRCWQYAENYIIEKSKIIHKKQKQETAEYADIGDKYLFAGYYRYGTYYIDSGTLNKKGDILSFGYKCVPSTMNKRITFEIFSRDISRVRNFLNEEYVISFSEYNLKNKLYRDISSVHYDKTGHILMLFDYSKTTLKETPFDPYIFHEIPEESDLAMLVKVVLTQYKDYIKEE